MPDTSSESDYGSEIDWADSAVDAALQQFERAGSFNRAGPTAGEGRSDSSAGVAGHVVDVDYERNDDTSVEPNELRSKSAAQPRPVEKATTPSLWYVPPLNLRPTVPDRLPVRCRERYRKRRGWGALNVSDLSSPSWCEASRGQDKSEPASVLMRLSPFLGSAYVSPRVKAFLAPARATRNHHNRGRLNHPSRQQAHRPPRVHPGRRQSGSSQDREAGDGRRRASQGRRVRQGGMVGAADPQYARLPRDAAFLRKSGASALQSAIGRAGADQTRAASGNCLSSVGSAITWSLASSTRSSVGTCQARANPPSPPRSRTISDAKHRRHPNLRARRAAAARPRTEPTTRPSASSTSSSPS